MADDITIDEFLGGALRLRQPARGYRAGTDPVYLAAAVPARAGESVLELGCGTGAAALCLARRVAGVKISGLELQPEYAALARENAAENDLSLEVVEGDLAHMPRALRACSFDHVMANPPYYLRDFGTAAANPGRETALGEAQPLAAWIDAGLKRLRPGGQITLIQAADRLPDILAAFHERAGDIVVHPLQPRETRPAKRILVTALKAGKGPFRLAPPTLLHDGPAHDGDRDSYSAVAQAVLRQGQSWPWIAR